MPPRELRSDARENRERIIRVARRRLAEQPATSSQELATAAGVSRATLTRHFPVRADLLGELHRRYLGELLAEAQAGELPADLWALGALARRLAAVACAWQPYRYCPLVVPGSAALLERLHDTLREALAAGQAAGWLRRQLSVEELTTLFLLPLPFASYGTRSSGQLAALMVDAVRVE